MTDRRCCQLAEYAIGSPPDRRHFPAGRRRRRELPRILFIDVASLWNRFLQPFIR